MLSRAIPVAVVTAASLLVAAPASAADTIGEAYAPTGSGGQSCGNFGGTVIQAESAGNLYAAPYDGVITSWGSRGRFGTMTMKVARLGAGSSFTVIATDGPRTYSSVGSMLERYPVRVPVRQGDVLGARIPVANYYCRRSQPGDLYGIVSADVQPGQTASFESTAAARMAIEAQIERDIDGDGYGDETQDLCPSDPTLHGVCDTLPPETTISKGPKKKTKSKKATFVFASSEPGSTFECSLDGAKFRPCASPKKVTVRERGRHNFLVRARDSRGNLDTTEDGWSWKVLKKKRKRK